MQLFNEKVIENALGSSELEIPTEHAEIVTNWRETITSGVLKRKKETSVHAPFTQHIFINMLGYTSFASSKKFTIHAEYPVGSGSVDLALGYFSEDKSTDVVIAPFELKGAITRDLDAIMPGRHKTPVQQAWEYARDIKGAKWVLVTNYVELRLYAVSETSLVYESFDLTKLTDPAEYARFVLLLHADNFLTGNTENLLRLSLLADKEITNQLYEDYKSLRENLIVNLASSNPHIPTSEIVAPAQKLLDRFLFIAFAEDRGLIPENSIKKAFEHSDPYNPRPVYENFKGLFRAIDTGNEDLSIPAYNGGLFAQDDQLDELVVSDELCAAVDEIAEYDFESEVSVTILGHIFEQSITDLETLSESIESGSLPTEPAVKKRSVSGKRKRQGVVYTPDQITAFIVEHTLGAYLNNLFADNLAEYGKVQKDGTIKWKRGKNTERNFWKAWQDALREVKIVDPACGSGAFLVAAFDFMQAEYQRTNDKLADLTGQRSLLDLNKEILTNNLYGVDINPESIEISKLSLWLKTAMRGKPLTSLDTNLLAGNSLGFDKPAPNESFCWREAFPEIMEQGGFDVVLGNPPYVRMELLKDIKPWLAENYQVVSDRADLYAYFFELGRNILKPDGFMGYISSSTFFKARSGKPLREFLTANSKLENIIDFGDLQVFEGVTTYPAIVTLSNRPIQKEDTISILNVKEDIPANLNQTFVQEAGVMSQQQLRPESWQLEDMNLSKLRSKIRDNHQSLKDIYGAPLYGIKTGFNEAFVIDRSTRDKLIAADSNSDQLLKPFFEGKDLKKWHAESRDLWIVYIPKNSIEIEDYPAVKEWLYPFKERLEKRATKQQWFELQQAQLAYQSAFEGVKIFYPDIADECKFHIDKSGAYSGNTGYFLPVDDYYALGLLNSSTVWFFLKGVSDSVRGGFYRMFTQNMNRIPVPKASPKMCKAIGEMATQCQELAEERFEIESSFRRRIPDLCPEDADPKLNKKLTSWWLLDFSDFQKQVKSRYKTTIPVAERNDWQDYFSQEKEKIESLTSQIVDLEAQLDQQVYKLFKLTPKEIALLEAEIR